MVYKKKKKKKKKKDFLPLLIYTGIMTFKNKPVCFQGKQTLPRGYKTFFMLTSVEHENSNAHKYKNIKKFRLFRLR